MDLGVLRVYPRGGRRRSNTLATRDLGGHLVPDEALGTAVSSAQSLEDTAQQQTIQLRTALVEAAIQLIVLNQFSNLLGIVRLDHVDQDRHADAYHVVLYLEAIIECKCECIVRLQVYPLSCVPGYVARPYIDRPF